MRSLCAFFLTATALLAQGGVNPGVNPVKLASPPTDTWPTYNGDYSGRRFSPLTKINSSNINSLSLAFVYRANGMPGGQSGFSAESSKHSYHSSDRRRGRPPIHRY